jgi:tetratricopeptide (TPR) repeat protein
MTASGPPSNPSPRLTWLAAVLLAAVVLAWSNSFHGPFVFDDLPSLRDNAALRDWRTAFAPPAGGLTVSGRPLLNATFALNHRLHGDAVSGYHAVNLLIHAAAALVLLGLLRRTFRLPALAPRFAAGADWLALGSAGLWALHPLQTESVTYIVQRAESLAGLFYLLVLYAFVRAATSSAPRPWWIACWVACLAGVLTKETVVTVPLLLLLYDRAFLAGSFAAAWRARRGAYLALAATWLVAGALVLAGASRGGTAGLHSPAAPWQYALLQIPAIAHYLRLALWPHPLVFDYGPFQSVSWREVLPGAAVTLPALAGALWLLVRRPAAGFAAGGFFLLLAPSSSIVPVASQVMAEHRLYLPLAVGIAGIAAWSYLRQPRSTLVGLALLAATATAATWQRNRLYHTPLGLWQATADAAPTNPRAQLNAGEQLARAGRPAEAADRFAAALRLQPGYIAARFNLGLALLELRRPAEAAEHLTTALRLNPDHAGAAFNLGRTHLQLGRTAEAATAFARAVDLAPEQPSAHFQLAHTLVELGRLAEAVDHFGAAARLAPGEADYRFNHATALLQAGRNTEAIAEYEAVLRLNPGDAEAARNLAIARAR